MKKYLAYLGTLFVVPALAFAQSAAPTITSGQSLANYIVIAINTIAVPLIFAFAFIAFLYGVLKTFILSRGDKTKIAEGRNLVIWSLVGFFVMVSVWGLVNILVGTVNTNTNVPNYPQAPTTH